MSSRRSKPHSATRVVPATHTANTTAAMGNSATTAASSTPAFMSTQPTAKQTTQFYTDRDAKLRAIYAALDSNNSSKAQKVLTQATDRYGNQPVLAVLYAILLDKKDQSSAAITLLQYLVTHNAISSDWTAIRLALMLLRQHQQWRVMIQLCKHSLTLYSNNLELLTTLHTLYHYTMQYSEQQKLAMKLYSLADAQHKPRYAYSSAMALLLSLKQHERRAQQHSVEQPITFADMKLLQLSAAMMQRHVTADTTLTTAEVETLFKVLTAINKHDDANKLLMSKPATSFRANNPLEHMRLYVQALQGAQQYDTLSTVLEEFLVAGEHRYADDWYFLQRYIDASVHRHQAGHAPAIDQCRKLLEQLQQHELSLGKKRRRGSLLAGLELEYRLHQLSKQSTTAMTDSLVRYFDAFGHREVFFSDVHTYVLTLSKDEQQQLIRTLHASLKLDNAADLLPALPSSTTNTDAMQRQLTVHRLMRLTGFISQLSAEQQQKYVDQYKAIAAHAQSTQQAVAPEQAASDTLTARISSAIAAGYLQLYALLQIDRYVATNDTQHIADALQHLQAVLDADAGFAREQWMIRMLCVRLALMHPQTSNAAYAIKLWVTTDVKQVQHDTLSHLLLHDLLRTGHRAEAQKVCNDIINLHSEAERDQLTYSEQAIEAGQYTVGTNFAVFHQRMRYSVTKATALIENIHLELSFLETKSLSAVTRLLQTKLHQLDQELDVDEQHTLSQRLRDLVDNRDLSSITSYHQLPSTTHQLLNDPQLHLFTAQQTPSKLNADEYPAAAVTGSTDTETLPLVPQRYQQYMEFRYVQLHVLHQLLTGSSDSTAAFASYQRLVQALQLNEDTVMGLQLRLYSIAQDVEQFAGAAPADCVNGVADKLGEGLKVSSTNGHSSGDVTRAAPTYRTVADQLTALHEQAKALSTGETTPHYVLNFVLPFTLLVEHWKATVPSMRQDHATAPFWGSLSMQRLSGTLQLQLNMVLKVLSAAKQTLARSSSSTADYQTEQLMTTVMRQLNALRGAGG